MKTINKKYSASLVALGLFVTFLAQNTTLATKPEGANKHSVPNVRGSTPLPTTAPSVAATTFTEAQIMETYGWLVSANMGLVEFEFTPTQIDAMLRGIKLATQGKKPSCDDKKIGVQMEKFLSEKHQTFLSKLRIKNLVDSATFFAKLKKNKNVQELQNGLRYEVLEAGSGATPKEGQIAKIHYTGRFINGQVFDSSVERGEPFELLVQGTTEQNSYRTIPGIIEGLKKMKVGEKTKLYIPPHLAYGDEGTQGIPPAATLIFEIKLLEVKDAPAAKTEK